MRAFPASRIPVICCVALLAGCGTPEVKYKLASDGESLPNGSIRFDLRTTNIALTKSGAQPSGSTTQTGSKTSRGISTTQSPTTKVDDNCPNPIPQGLEPWLACLQGVSAPASIEKFGKQTYVAIPNNDVLHLQTTQLSATPVDNDELLIKQVTVVFKDNTKSTITATGEGAVAGFALGPYGALAGAFIGFTGAVVTTEAVSPPFPYASVDDLICRDESDDSLGAGPSFQDKSFATLKPKLALPVVIDFERAKPRPGPDSDCWHMLPNNTQLWSGKLLVPTPAKIHRAPMPGDGWLYRILPGDPPKNTVSRDKYFAFRTDGYTEVKGDFPYSACQAITLEVTWWKELDNALSGAKKLYENGQVTGSQIVVTPIRMSYAVTIANPDYIGAVNLPRSGTINLGSVCGAYASLSASSSSVLTDDFDALVKEYGNIKKAQSDWATSQKPTPAPTKTPTPTKK